MRQARKGQIVVEYTLLLVVVVAIVTIMINVLVSRGQPRGLLIDAWFRMIQVIGEDAADDPN